MLWRARPSICPIIAQSPVQNQKRRKGREEVQWKTRRRRRGEMLGIGRRQLKQEIKEYTVLCICRVSQ
jgi:hypothetical protein